MSRTSDTPSRPDGGAERVADRSVETTPSRSPNLDFSPNDFRTAAALTREVAQPGSQVLPVADVNPTGITFTANAAALELAKVRAKEGPYQTADRLLGQSFTPQEKLAFTRALQAQYREEIGTRPELAGRKRDMSDLRVGHSLLTQENYGDVMAKLKEKNAALHDRVIERLKQGATDAAPTRRETPTVPDESSAGRRSARPAEGESVLPRPDPRRRVGPQADPERRVGPQVDPERRVAPRPDAERRVEPRPDGERVPQQADATVLSEFTSKATGYYPHNSRMQGGHFDRRGKPLHTLQDFLDNPSRTPYVSVAMDIPVAPYGTPIRIPELDQKYRAQLERHGLTSIPFRLVDTGGRFHGRGTDKIDICNRTREDAWDPSVNRSLTVQILRETPQQRQRPRGEHAHAGHGHSHEPPRDQAPVPVRERTIARYAAARDQHDNRGRVPEDQTTPRQRETRPGAMPTLAPVTDTGITSRVPGALFIGQGDKWLAPEAARAFVRARDILKERYGIDLQANEKNGAGRSYAQQQDIWRRHLQGQVSRAARPGHSNHEHGRAVDFANLVRPGEAAQVRQVLREVGFTPGDRGVPIPNDEWHWTYHGGRTPSARRRR